MSPHFSSHASLEAEADSDRNVDLYHWSSAKFSSTWYDTLSVLVAKGRAKVSVAASEADWSKRIAFARCSMQTMKITRWARNEPPWFNPFSYIV